jgi:hypothetical protein
MRNGAWARRGQTPTLTPGQTPTLTPDSDPNDGAIRPCVCRLTTMTISLPETARTRDNTAGAVLVGLRAAWRTPSIVARDFAGLLVPPPASREGSTDSERTNIAVRVAHRALAWLVRVRPSRWRATCLHRSVAECVVLRTYGLPARVVIGVGNGAAPATTIAHAWVECEGVRCQSTRGAAELETLTPARA